MLEQAVCLLQNESYFRPTSSASGLEHDVRRNILVYRAFHYARFLSALSALMVSANRLKAFYGKEHIVAFPRCLREPG